MSRLIKFNAYIPEFGIIIPDVNLYNDGTIGIKFWILNNTLKKENKYCYIDRVHRCIWEDNKEKKLFKNRMDVKVFDDWVKINYDDYTLLQYTGLNDTEGNEIYEGDILEVNTPPYSYMNMIESRTIRLSVISFKHYQFVQLLYKGDKVFMIDSLSSLEDTDKKIQPKTYKVIGNVHQHKHLLTKTK